MCSVTESLHHAAIADSVDDALTVIDNGDAQRNLNELTDIIADAPTEVVFLVGAGLSTLVPAPSSIIRSLVREAATLPGLAPIRAAADDLPKLGFEITLNDLRSVCQSAPARVFSALAASEAELPPSPGHQQLRGYLERGGCVLSTNYDRLIERDRAIPVRFDASASDRRGFAGWRHDLDRGGVLFKLHGSFDDPMTCLGVLEDVGTSLSGERGELLSAIVRNRIMCVVGWSGVDPDIPATFLAALRDRPKHLPIYWLHHTSQSIQRIGVRMQPIARRWPLIGSADTTLEALFRSQSSPPQQAMDLASPSFQLAELCSASARARFAGQVMRRAGREHLASVAFRVATSTAANTSEWTSAREERALTIWASAHGRPSRELKARGVLVQVAQRLETEGMPPQAVRGPLFGLLSMSVSLSDHYWWLLLGVPRQVCRMLRALRSAEFEGADRVDIETKEILTFTYVGRLRMLFLGRLGRHSRTLARWAIEPHRIASRKALTLPNRSLHARFDALASHAIAAARLGMCAESSANRVTLDSLSLLLDDPRRSAYWAAQSQELDRRCGEGDVDGGRRRGGILRMD